MGLREAGRENLTARFNVRPEPGQPPSNIQPSASATVRSDGVRTGFRRPKENYFIPADGDAADAGYNSIASSNGWALVVRNPRRSQGRLSRSPLPWPENVLHGRRIISPGTASFQTPPTIRSLFQRSIAATWDVMCEQP